MRMGVRLVPKLCIRHTHVVSITRYHMRLLDCPRVLLLVWANLWKIKLCLSQ
jgi:hypothetical protein